VLKEAQDSSSLTSRLVRFDHLGEKMPQPLKRCKNHSRIFGCFSPVVALLEKVSDGKEDIFVSEI
jgi:hypothetical protein